MSARGQMVGRQGSARGTIDANGRTMLAVRFDEFMFDEVRTLAISLNISVAEQVRIFIREGLKRRADARRAA